MPDFKNFTTNPSAPATSFYAITPADANLARPVRAIYVGGAGNLTITSPAGESVLITGVQAGVIYPFSAIRVSATGTTATALVGIE